MAKNKPKPYHDTQKENIKGRQMSGFDKSPYFSLVAVLVLVILGFAVYGNTIINPFIWDDTHLVVENTRIRDLSGAAELFTKNIVSEDILTSFYRPAQMLSYLIDHSLWGYNPKGYHITNICLHILAASALFWLIFVLFGDGWLAMLTSIFFLIHPVHTEAVAYISGRPDTLAALFIFLCLIFYIRFLDKKNILVYALAVFAFALALLSKEFALIVPALILVYHFAFSRKVNWPAFLGLFAIIGAYFIVRRFLVLTVHHQLAASMLGRIPGVFAAVAQYIRLLVAPYGLHMGYGQKFFSLGSPLAMAGIVLFISLIVVAVRKKKKNPLVCFSIIWFFVALLPHSNIYPLNAYMAEHWLYLPSVGFFLIAAHYLKKMICALKKKGILIILAIVIFYSFLTVKQNRLWHDPVAFYRRIIQYNPEYVEAHNDLGVMLARENKYTEAIASYKEALRIDPSYVDAKFNMANTLLKLGKVEEAKMLYAEAISKAPNDAKALFNLGLVFMREGNITEAVRCYQDGLKIKPGSAVAHNNLGLLLDKSGKREEAAGHFLEAIKIRPNYAEAHNNLANVYARQVKTEEAVAHYREALLIAPGYNEAHFNFGLFFSRQGDLESSVKHYKSALQIDPSHVSARINLANVLARQGKNEEAKKHYAEALRIDPENLTAKFNLGTLLVDLGDYDSAMGYYEEILTHSPASPGVLYATGVIFEKKKEYEKAKEIYLEVLEKDPQHQDAKSGLERIPL